MRARPQHDPAYRRLCRRLRQWRLDAKLTQRQLGDLLRRPHTFVHKVEVGDRRIDPIEFIKWCGACGKEAGQALREVVKAK